MLFQSTLSVRRATDTRPDAGMVRVISIHALREESDPASAIHRSNCRRISIHALREESDLDPSQMTGKFDISIHVLREESDSTIINGLCANLPFQSTFSVRRATHRLPDRPQRQRQFQSTFSVRRATSLRISQYMKLIISIHVLREESDADKIITTKTQI